MSRRLRTGRPFLQLVVLMLWAWTIDPVSAARAAQNKDAASAEAEAESDSEIEPEVEDADISPAMAEILKMLRERGILTKDAYEDAYRREAEYQADQREKMQLPGWLRDWTFGGDIRMRYDRIDWGDEFRPGNVYVVGQDNVNPETNQGSGVRERMQLRLRIGAEKKLSQDFLFGFRLATAPTFTFGEDVQFDNGRFPRSLESDPRGPNVSLGDYFSDKPIAIDRAYMRWSPSFLPSLRITGGKFANPFLTQDNLAERIMWDNDINPEGVIADYRFDFLPEQVWLDMAGGYFFLDEVPGVTLQVPVDPELGSVTVAPSFDERDPGMWGLQAGVTGDVFDWMRANGRISYYELYQLGTDFSVYINENGNGGDAVSENPLLVLSSTPTSGASDGKLQELVFDGYLRMTPFGERYMIKPFFQYSQILTANGDNDAYALGVELGSETELVDVTVMYGNIERNGTVAIFTDNVIFDGLTNVEGWYVSAQRKLNDFLSLRGSFSKMKIEEEHCLVNLVEPENCDTSFAAAPALLEQFRQTQRDRVRWQVDMMMAF